MRTLVKALLWIGGILGVVFGIIYFVWLDVWTLPSDDSRLTLSIAPTMTAGDVVLVTRDPGTRVGYLVKCLDPQATGRSVVGRVIANNPRDEVEVIGGIARVNGQRAPSPRGCEIPRMTLTDPANGATVDVVCSVEEIGGDNVAVLVTPGGTEKNEAVVDSAHAYLLSDDRTLHQDSRDYGQVDTGNCQHIVFRLWSAQGLGDSMHRFNVLW